MNPLISTQNSLSHIDYGIPLLIRKSTDYRTSTGKNHEYQPNIPQLFDCRVKTKCKSIDRDIKIKDNQKSSCNNDYGIKNIEPTSNPLYKQCDKVEYIKSAEEKIFMQPPSMRNPEISEMKNKYQFNDSASWQNQNVNVKCEIPKTFNEIQPQINTNEKSYYKFLDIYLTENKLNFVPYSNDELYKAKEDLITIYNFKGSYRGLKQPLPGKLHGRTNIHDKSIFKVEFPSKFLSRAPKRVLHCGMSSEYQTIYQNPTQSDFYPNVHNNDVYYPDYIYKIASSNQDLSAPGMYFTENHHIGSAKPVRTHVNINAPVKQFKHY